MQKDLSATTAARIPAPQRLTPLNAFEKRGINTAIGLDEAGINDDRDMLQEMRMVLRAHRVPGRRRKTSRAPARCCAWRGRRLPLMLIDGDKLTYPYLDPETPVLDAVIQRAKSGGVDLVMVAGEVVYEGGRFTRVDRDAALRELHASLQHELGDDEVERRALSKTLLPHIRRFYAGYFDPEAHQPFYRPSSRV